MKNTSRTLLSACQGAAFFGLPALGMFIFGIFIHLGALTEWIQLTAYVWPTLFLFIGMFFTVPDRRGRVWSTSVIVLYGTVCAPLTLFLMLLPPLDSPLPVVAISWIAVIGLPALFTGLLLWRLLKEISYMVVSFSVAIAAHLIAFLAESIGMMNTDYSVEAYRIVLTTNAWYALGIWALCGLIVGAALAQTRKDDKASE